LTQFLTGRKHGQLLGALILRFNHKTKLTKQCTNYSKKFSVKAKRGGGGHTIALFPKYITAGS